MKQFQNKNGKVFWFSGEKKIADLINKTFESVNMDVKPRDKYRVN